MNQELKTVVGTSKRVAEVTEHADGGFSIDWTMYGEDEVMENIARIDRQVKAKKARLREIQKSINKARIKQKAQKEEE